MSTKKQNVVVKKSSKTLVKPNIQDKTTDRESGKETTKKKEDTNKKIVPKPTPASSRNQIKSTLKQQSTPKIQPGKNVIPKQILTTKRSSPSTPTSSRVSKSQFYPSKQMYSNALQTNSIKTTDKSKILLKEEKKVHEIERPRTATLRKGSIVNENIVGPEAPPHKVQKIKTPELEDEYNYEDDFDSYASDFEEYASSEHSSLDINVVTSGEITSSTETEEDEKEPEETKRINSAEEERKLDSGNFDLPENKHKQILDNITEGSEIRLNSGSLSDEGFEEAKSLQFVNFLGAKKELAKIEVKKLSRGEELMQMIKLDQENFTLFDLPPISYDDYIRSFGNRNSTQVSCQTGDENIEEEIQTDQIDLLNKWTQFPPTFTKINETEGDYLKIYHEELFGVGGDFRDAKNIQNDYNENSLKNFLLNAGGLIFSLIQEQSQNHSKEIEIDERNLPFSEGYITLDTNFLHGRTITHLSFSENVGVLSFHSPKELHGDTDGNELKSIGCVWNLQQPNEPEEVFGVFGWVNCSCFNVNNNKVIFGGMKDGTVTVWDLSETPEIINQLTVHSENRIILKPACFTTEINENFCSKIISVCSCLDVKDEIMKSNKNWSATTQVVTLDEVGNIIIWGLISKPRLKKYSSNHLSLVRNSLISLNALYPELRDLNCTDLYINQEDFNHIYVTTNHGFILHCLASGTKPNPKMYHAASISSANCIEGCPYLSDYFLVGFQNGEISLYSRTIERPLMTMCDQDGYEAIDIVQWSRNKPCVFYVKDKKNTIHIWDFAYSELYPTHSIPFKDEIKFIRVSPRNRDNVNTRSYLAIVTNTDMILLHILNKEHKQQDPKIFETELKKFTKYLKLL